MTVYASNQGDFDDIRFQLRRAIRKVEGLLASVTSPTDRTNFLAPLKSLVSDSSLFRQMRGSVGIIRTLDSFRVVKIPFAVDYTCQLATSFHVKPLLRWSQTDQEFLLLGLEERAAHLYSGSQVSLRHVDSIEISFQNSSLETISEWLAKNTKHSKPVLYLAGTRSQIDSVYSSLQYPNLIKSTPANSFAPESVSDVCAAIRSMIREDSHRFLNNALNEFKDAEHSHHARTDIFQISKAVVEGQVRKLIVTDDFNIFGKIDSQSGALVIHPFDQDHEDDDVLDDLAQMVLSQGRDVVVAKRDEMPRGRPIVAILKPNSLKRIT